MAVFLARENEPSVAPGTCSEGEGLRTVLGQGNGLMTHWPCHSISRQYNRLVKSHAADSKVYRQFMIVKAKDASLPRKDLRRWDLCSRTGPEVREGPRWVRGRRKSIPTQALESVRRREGETDGRG
jgi:hypothetical protein